MGKKCSVVIEKGKREGGRAEKFVSLLLMKRGTNGRRLRSQMGEIAHGEGIWIWRF